jgi:phosphate acyltransferase
MKIAVDAMGGDYAPDEIVKGAVEAASEFTEDIIFLVGEQEKVRRIIGSGKSLPNIKIIHTDEFITMDESPTTALRTKKKSTMKIAAELVKSGECDAMISAGNTGALFEICLITMGRISGIKRPALAVLMPTKKGPCMLLDAGANADCKPEYLVQFAKMASIYMERVAGINNPRVGLINIGEEEGKGSLFYRQVHDCLKGEPGLNFTGNVESRGMMAGHVDVAVADGFVGNIVLKSSEAAADFMTTILKDELKKSVVAKMAALTLKPIFRVLKKRLDHSEYGGAILLGLNGILVKSHGRADARTIYNAIRVSKIMYNQQVQKAIEEFSRAEKSAAAGN